MRLIWKYDSKKGIKYGIGWRPRGFWYHNWTPIWHKGRGRYISIGLWMLSFYRGY